MPIWNMWNLEQAHCIHQYFVHIHWQIYMAVSVKIDTYMQYAMCIANNRFVVHKILNVDWIAGNMERYAMCSLKKILKLLIKKFSPSKRKTTKKKLFQKHRTLNLRHTGTGFDNDQQIEMFSISFPGFQSNL